MADEEMCQCEDCPAHNGGDMCNCDEANCKDCETCKAAKEKASAPTM